MALKRSQGTVLITGASTGIGAATALLLDRAGFHVFAGVRKEADGAALKQQATTRLQYLLLDVTDAGSIAAAAQIISNSTGEQGLAGLVNNAGIVVAGPLELIEGAQLRRQFEVNVHGPLELIQQFLPQIRRSRGRIVNIGSIGGRISAPFLGPYAASKFALAALSDSLRVELRPWGINVSLIEPGAISTPIWDKSVATSRTLEAGFAPAHRDLYGPALDAVENTVNKIAKNALPPETVARTVLHALTARNPKPRYVVGTDAKIQAFLVRFASFRLLDWLMQLSFNLPRAPKS